MIINMLLFKMASFIILALMLILLLLIAIVALAIKCCVIIVPERRTVILERMGKFHSQLPPGWHFLFPVIDR